MLDGGAFAVKIDGVDLMESIVRLVTHSRPFAVEPLAEDAWSLTLNGGDLEHLCVRHADGAPILAEEKQTGFPGSGEE